MANTGVHLRTEAFVRQGEGRHSHPFPDSGIKAVLSPSDGFPSIWSGRAGLLSISYKLYDGTCAFSSYHVPSLASFPLLPTHESHPALKTWFKSSMKASPATLSL